MKYKNSKLKDSGGYTLVEALVALILTAVVITTIFEVYITQHRNWNVQTDISDMQQNARAAIDELTRQIRMAGNQLPLGIDPIEAYNTDPDTIVINYSPDGCNAPIVKPMPLPSSELDCKGNDVSCFSEGQMAYIFHPDSGGGEFFEISHVQETPAKIQHNKWPLTKTYDQDAIIVSLERMKYYIDNSDTLHPNLMIQFPWDTVGHVYAENIEDLQIQYRMKNGSIVDVPPLVDDVREVLITITAHTNSMDPDHPTEPYKQRRYTSRVNLRNFF